ncbi:MAG: UDP-2,4-diacetamido-2,4,6-trideoxy-beta-L-altropyranose hydrolase [Lachnospiraceae bacterium]|nr:UDP-2,4-diacetamido-2,4,6-trideoxy-beta-L-altropyranose hydrolase [Lachnospiraceae bacterium]
MKKIYFRTDGNEEIATGHIMRCLSIARACTALHAEVCFLMSDETSKTILEERFLIPNEFNVRCLNSDYQSPETELPALRKLLTEEKGNWLFIDSYFVTEHYLSELKRLCQIAYLDDILAFDYPADLLINYDVTYEPNCYHKASQKLLGTSYTPLREQFQNVSYEVRPQVQNILLSTGGTDTYNVAGELLNKIFQSTHQTALDNYTPQKDFAPSALPNYHYHVVTSRLNSHYEELQKIAAANPTIHIHENVQDMASLMCQCDLSISAGGTTLYELCAVGVPAISFAMADNQLTAVETFSAQNIIPYAGDVRDSFSDVLDTMLAFLNEQSSSMEARKKSSHAMRAFIDGKGAMRIAKVLTTQ